MQTKNRATFISKLNFVYGFLCFTMLIPVASFLTKVLALLIYMVNLPFLDDWREFVTGNAGSFRIHSLFKPANDTLYPVGKILDNLFVTLLDSNVIAYQFLSLTIVLGSLLYLQYYLLRKSIDNKFILAASFVSLVFMLQPGSYWGLQFIAYHQAIPLICVLVILLLATQKTTWWRLALMAMLTMIAGFVYISGAIAMTVLATVFLLRFRIRDRKLQASLLRSGLTVGVTSLIPLSAQVWVIAVFQHGNIHTPKAKWILPNNMDFWFYVLGKIARALGFSPAYPLLSLILTLVLIVAGVIATTYLFFSNYSSATDATATTIESTNQKELFTLIITSLIAVVAVYLSLVAAGRAGLRPETINTPLEIFTLGFARFHFFWVTILTPWIIAAVLCALEHFIKKIKVTPIFSAAAISIMLSQAWVNGLFAHGSYFKEQADDRSRNLHCIQNALNAGFDRIYCPPGAYPGNLMPALIHATLLNASFTRYLPDRFFLPNENVFYRFSGENARAPEGYLNAVATKVKSRTVLFADNNDPQILVDIGTRAAKCRALQISITEKIDTDNVLQIFYVLPGEKDFSENLSQTTVIPADQESRVNILLRSKQGFGSRLRIDPAVDSQIIDLKNIEVGCLSFEK